MSEGCRDGDVATSSHRTTPTDPAATLPSDRSPASADQYPGQLGPVQLIEVIGAGASGVVYRARDRLLDRDVAVKILRPLAGVDSASRQRLLDEARAAAAVTHPNLVTIFQAGFSKDSPYLVLEYVRGPTLAEVIRRHGPLKPAVVASILTEVAAAVGELHRHGIIHRDIKPGNILLDLEGRVHVTDLGICLRGRQSVTSGQAEVAGTPAYMAPEQFEGRTSMRTDVYAVGVTVFELLTGGVPFDRPWPEIQDAHRQELLPSDRLRDQNISPALIDVIERAVHKQASFRYKAVEDFARAFLAATGSELDPGKARRELSTLVCLPTPSAPMSGRLPAACDGSSSTSLAEIAQAARRRRAAGGQGGAGKRDRDYGAVDGAELPCIHCRYDLRVLPSAGRCPECSADLADSLDPARVLFADRKWLDRVLMGHALVLVSLGVAMGMMLLNAGVRAFPSVRLDRAMLHVALSGNIYHVELNDVAFGAESVVCLLPLAAGVWMITSPRPHWRHRLQAVCRAAVVIDVLLAASIAAAALLRVSANGWIIVPGYEFDPHVPRQFGLGPVLTLLEMWTGAIILTFLGQLVRSVPEQRESWRVRQTAIAFLSVAAVLVVFTNHDASPMAPNGIGYLRITQPGAGIIRSALGLLALVSNLGGWALFLASVLLSAKTFLWLVERRKATA